MHIKGLAIPIISLFIESASIEISSGVDQYGFEKWSSNAPVHKMKTFFYNLMERINKHEKMQGIEKENYENNCNFDEFKEARYYFDEGKVQKDFLGKVISRTDDKSYKIRYRLVTEKTHRNKDSSYFMAWRYLEYQILTGVDPQFTEKNAAFETDHKHYIKEFFGNKKLTESTVYCEDRENDAGISFGRTKNKWFVDGTCNRTEFDSFRQIYNQLRDNEIEYVHNIKCYIIKQLIYKNCYLKDKNVCKKN